jgi:hypothetical protein
MNNKTIIFLFVFILCGCANSTKKKKIDDSQFTEWYDTIYCPFSPNLGMADTCMIRWSNYVDVLGWKVSRYYEIKQTLFSDINSDDKLDSLVILIPYYNWSKFSGVDICHNNFPSDDINCRRGVLLTKVSAANGSYQVGRYDHLFTCDWWFIHGYDLEVAQSGYVINGDKMAPNAGSWYYQMYVDANGGNMFLDSIHMEEFGSCLYDTTLLINGPLENFHFELLDSIRIKMRGD